LVVAVSANFTAAHARLAPMFTAMTGVAVEMVAGSTAKLATQIAHGAPYDVFLAADAEHAAWLEREGHAVAGSRVVYAVGRLALYRAAPSQEPLLDALRAGAFTHLAIANPDTAPYGVAAREALQRLGVWDTCQNKLVLGESIAQTLQFVNSGNAELGIVAWAQAIAMDRGESVLLDENLHAPLRQEAVLVARENAHPAAAGYLEFLTGPVARAVITDSGYTFPDTPVEAHTAGAPRWDWRPIVVTLKLATVTTFLLLVLGTPGLVIGSMLFSLPFVVQPLQTMFMANGERPLEAAATLRAGPFDRFMSVAFPLSRRGFLTAGTLSFAHTVGEFGVVLMLGGSIPGRTKVVSVAIYDHVEALQIQQAHLLSAGTVLFSFALLLIVFTLNRRVPMRAL
jgi:molybdate transport system substrate-binding protein